jgi:hypothetical protein
MLVCREQTQPIYINRTKFDKYLSNLSIRIQRSIYDTIMLFDVAVENDPFALKYIPTQPLFICKKAINKNPLSIEFIKEKTVEMCKRAYNNNFLSLAYCTDILYDIVECDYKKILRKIHKMILKDNNHNEMRLCHLLLSKLRETEYSKEIKNKLAKFLIKINPYNIFIIKQRSKKILNHLMMHSNNSDIRYFVSKNILSFDYVFKYAVTINARENNLVYDDFSYGDANMKSMECKYNKSTNIISVVKENLCICELNMNNKHIISPKDIKDIFSTIDMLFSPQFIYLKQLHLAHKNECQIDFSSESVNDMFDDMCNSPRLQLDIGEDHNKKYNCLLKAMFCPFLNSEFRKKYKSIYEKFVCESMLTACEKDGAISINSMKLFIDGKISAKQLLVERQFSIIRKNPDDFWSMIMFRCKISHKYHDENIKPYGKVYKYISLYYNDISDEDRKNIGTLEFCNDVTEYINRTLKKYNLSDEITLDEIIKLIQTTDTLDEHLLYKCTLVYICEFFDKMYIEIGVYDNIKIHYCTFLNKLKNIQYAHHNPYVTFNISTLECFNCDFADISTVIENNIHSIYQIIAFKNHNIQQVMKACKTRESFEKFAQKEGLQFAKLIINFLDKFSSEYIFDDIFFMAAQIFNDKVSYDKISAIMEKNRIYGYDCYEIIYSGTHDDLYRSEPSFLSEFVTFITKYYKNVLRAKSLFDIISGETNNEHIIKMLENIIEYNKKFYVKYYPTNHHCNKTPNRSPNNMMHTCMTDTFRIMSIINQIKNRIYDEEFIINLIDFTMLNDYDMDITFIDPIYQNPRIKKNGVTKIKNDLIKQVVKCLQKQKTNCQCKSKSKPSFPSYLIPI